ncbi:hypothetical protein D3C72_502660 [compost metagenome]
MRRWVALLSAMTLVLGACNMAAPGKARTPVKPKATASASPKPTATRKPVLLEGPTASLKGTIAIDAHYILSNNAGGLISNNGSSAIALKEGKLLSDNGLGLLSDNGLGLLSDNGLGIIANNSGGLISNNGSGYRILADAVPLGKVLPVKGMAVFPISLRTGEIVARPVFTDAKGGYTLEVPEAVKGNIRLVARVPVAKANDPIAVDPRIQYNLVIKTGAVDPVIDEDSSVATRYLRASFSGRLLELMVAQDIGAAAEELVKSMGFAPSLKEILMSSVTEVNATAKEAGVPAMTVEAQKELAQRLTDILLSYVDLDTLVVDPVKYGKFGPKEPAIPGLVDIVRQMREGATERMTADAEFFDKQFWISREQRLREIKKPTDVCDYIVDNYLLSLDGRVGMTKTAFANIGVPEEEADRLNAIAIGVLAAVGQTLLTGPTAKTEMLAAIKASKR